MASGGRRRGTVLIFVALILILLVVLAYAVTKFYNPFAPPAPVAQQTNPQVQATPVIEMEKIVISIQPIKRGKEITSDVITTIDIPRSSMVGGAFITKPEDVIGKRAKIDIEARVPFNPNLLVDPSVKNSPAAFQIPRGQVAISIPVSNLSSVSYGLQAGDHVNVITTLLLVDLDTEFQSKLPNLTGVVVAPGAGANGGPTTLSATITKSDSPTGRTELDKTLGQPIYLMPSESPRPRLVSQTLIQDAVVLQVGIFPQTSTTAAPTTGAANPPAAQPTPVAGQEQAPAAAVKLPDTITLVVTPQDAVTLNYLIVAGGKLNLAMRSAGDDQRIATEAVTLQFVLDQYNIPSPAKLPYGLEPRLDIFPAQLNPFPPAGPNTDQTVVTPVP